MHSYDHFQESNRPGGLTHKSYDLLAWQIFCNPKSLRPICIPAIPSAFLNVSFHFWILFFPRLQRESKRLLFIGNFINPVIAHGIMSFALSCLMCLRRMRWLPPGYAGCRRRNGLQKYLTCWCCSSCYDGDDYYWLVAILLILILKNGWWWWWWRWWWWSSSWWSWRSWWWQVPEVRWNYSFHNLHFWSCKYRANHQQKDAGVTGRLTQSSTPTNTQNKKQKKNKWESKKIDAKDPKNCMFILPLRGSFFPLHQVLTCAYPSVIHRGLGTATLCCKDLWECQWTRLNKANTSANIGDANKFSQIRFYKFLDLWKTNMSPEDWWLEDHFPFEMVPFYGTWHVYYGMAPPAAYLEDHPRDDHPSRDQIPQMVEPSSWYSMIDKTDVLKGKTPINIPYIWLEVM